MKKLLICLLILPLLSSCATAPIASQEATQEAQSFRPPAGMSNIYVIRREAWMGAAILVQTSIDGLMTGGLQTGTYIMKSVPPGSHSVSVFSNENQDSITIQAQAGQNYFYDVKSRMGMATAKFTIEQIGEAEARDAVLRGKRAKGM